MAAKGITRASFTPKAARKIVEAVKKVNNLPPDLVGINRKPRGQRESVFFTNNSGETAPKGGVVWLYEKEADLAYSGTKPDGSIIPMFGLVTTAIPNGGTGNCFISGVHKVLVSLATYENYAAYLGTYLDPPIVESWIAEPVETDSTGDLVDGRLLVMGQDPDADSATEAYYLLVEICGNGGFGLYGSSSTRQIVEVRCVAKWRAYLGS